MTWTAFDDRPDRTIEVGGATLPPLELVAAACSIVAAATHGWVVRSHLPHWWAYGAFFAGIAVFQAAYAFVLVARPSRKVAAAGIVATIGVLALYAWSRTVGLPLGPHAGQTEAIGRPDLVAAASETILVVVLAVLYRRPNSSGAKRVPVTASALIGVSIAAAAMLGPAGHGHQRPPSVSLVPVTVAASQSVLPPSETPPPEEDPPIEEPPACVVKAAPGIRQPASAQPGTARAVVYARAADVWLYEPAGDAATRLTDNGEGCWAADATFRDEARVTFTMDSTILEVDLRSGRLTEIVRETGWISTHAWSPDGTMLAYVRSGSDEEPREQVVLYRPSDGTKRVIRSLPSSEGRCGSRDDEASMFWSPDGNALLVQITHLAFGSDTMYVVSPSGADLVAARVGTHARWAPDSKTIYYREFDGDGRWFALDVGTGRRTSLAIPAGTHQLAVSPDGARLAYVDQTGDASLFVYNVAKRRSEKIAESAAAPLWLDPGTLMLTNTEPCEGECHGEWNLEDSTFAIDTDTGRRTPLAATTTGEAGAWYESPAPMSAVPSPSPTPSSSPTDGPTPTPTPTQLPTDEPSPEPQPEPSDTPSPAPSPLPTSTSTAS